MDIKLQLVKLITLIFRESQVGNTDNLNDDMLIKDIVNNIVIDDASSEETAETLTALKDTVGELLTQSSFGTISKDDLLQRVRINVSEDNFLYEALVTGVASDHDKESLLRICKGLRSELATTRLRAQVKKICYDAYVQTTFREKNVNWKNFIPTVINQLESFNDVSVDDQPASMIGSLDLTDKYAIKQMLIDGKDSVCGHGIMRMGWQGMNEMTDGGLRRGELVVVGALKHNFKSGMLLNIPRQVALYNKPYMLDETKKPLIVYISLENELKSNVVDLYNTLKELRTGEKSDITELDEERLIEASDFIVKELSVNGYHYKMLRFNPSDFTYQDLFNTLRKYETDGFEVHLLSIDYLAMMSMSGCSGTNGAGQIRDLYRRCRNFCAPRQITLLTAHQLSSDATNLLREGTSDFVSRVAGKSYYADCKAVDHEADLEITIHLEKPGDGHKYMTAHRGKHRKPTITPDNQHYQVYRFEEIGGLRDDIEGKSMARKSVGGRAESEGGGLEWWQVE